MFRRIFRRSSIVTSDGIDPWALPRLHRAAYKRKLAKLTRLLKKRGIDVNKLDRQGRSVANVTIFIDYSHNTTPRKIFHYNNALFLLVGIFPGEKAFFKLCLS